MEEDKNSVVITEKLDAEQNTVSEEVIPEGKIKCMDGRIVDRDKVVFTLVPHPENPDVLFASDGTGYYRGDRGELRRIDPKVSKKERRALREKRGR